MRKNALALSIGMFFTAVTLMGCFDGPSAPAQEEETLAKAAATTVVVVGFTTPVRSNSPQSDGFSQARSLCRVRLPRTRVVTFLSANRFISARKPFWSQRWSCRD